MSRRLELARASARACAPRPCARPAPPRASALLPAASRQDTPAAEASSGVSWRVAGDGLACWMPRGRGIRAPAHPTPPRPPRARPGRESPRHAGGGIAARRVLASGRWRVPSAEWRVAGDGLAGRMPRGRGIRAPAHPTRPRPPRAPPGRESPRHSGGGSAAGSPRHSGGGSAARRVLASRESRVASGRWRVPSGEWRVAEDANYEANRRCRRWTPSSSASSPRAYDRRR